MTFTNTGVNNWSIAMSQHPGIRSLQVYGRNESLTAAWEPVSFNGLLYFPTPANSLPLRIRAGGDALDTADGLGARSVIVIGLDVNGNFIFEVIDTAGVNASLPTVQTFFRVNFFRVADTGTYAGVNFTSHVGPITLETTAGAAVSVLTTADNFSRGNGGQAHYSTSKSLESYITYVAITPEGNKAIDVILMSRPSILDEEAPFSPMLTGSEWRGLEVPLVIPLSEPAGAIAPLTDVVFFARVPTGSATISVNYDIITRQVSSS